MKAKDQVCTNEDRSLWNHFMKQVHHLENRKKIKFSEALLILMPKLNTSAAKCESVNLPLSGDCQALEKTRIRVGK